MKKEIEKEAESSASKSEKEKKPKGIREIREIIIYLLTVITVVWLLLLFVVQRTEVSGSSMLPELHNGESIMIDKLTYRFHDPERFDIIVFDYLYQEDMHYIKRIIGLPGETVQIINSVIYINGEPLEESYGMEEKINNPGRAVDPIVLGEDEYFVLGDNRNGSSDSRSEDVANVKRSQIMGKAWLRIWPLNVFGLIHH